MEQSCGACGSGPAAAGRTLRAVSGDISFRGGNDYRCVGRNQPVSAGAAARALIYSKRQAVETKRANDRAEELAAANRVRWEVIKTDEDQYLLTNTGTHKVHQVHVDYPNYVSGRTLRLLNHRPWSSGK